MEYVVGVILAFFLSLLLFSKKGKTEADRILAFWLFFIGAHILLYYLFYTGQSLRHPWLLGVEMPLPLVHGPFLYLYTASLTDQFRYRGSLMLIHFVPVIAIWGYLVPFMTLPAAEKVSVYEHRGAGYEIFMMVKLAMTIISGIGYVAASAVLLQRHKRSILNAFSYTERINLRWLQYLVVGICILWLFIFINDRVVYWGAVAFVLFIGYFGIKQVGIFTHLPATPAVISVAQVPAPQNEPIVTNQPAQVSFIPQDVTPVYSPRFVEMHQEILPDPENVTRKKYAKSGLTTEMALKVHSDLRHLMNTQKAYLDSELSLADLAARLNVLPNYLSQVINEIEEKNFYDYINSLRIQEFIRLISIPGNTKYTILGLAFECGFNSKSSFNKNFKKAIGVSPSEYLNGVNKAA